MIILSLIILFSVSANGDELHKRVHEYLKGSLDGIDSINIINIESEDSIIEGLLPGSSRRGHIVTIPYEVMTDNETRRIRFLSVSVELYKYVPIVTTDVKAGEKLDENNVMMKHLDIAEKNTIREIKGDISELRASKYIKAGSIVSELNSERIPLVYAGQKVTAHKINGNIDISTDAFSKQEGSIGDIIRIKTTDKKQFKAKILNNQNVLIIE